MLTNFFKNLNRSLPAPLQNKYYLTLLVFFFWMCFLDRQSFYTQYKLARTVNHLEGDRVFYQGKIREVKDDAAIFEESKDRFAREHFLMHQPNEDVFIFNEK
jgi:cell division protein DivIC